MIDADAYLDPAGRAGIDFYAGVPCSFLTPIINRVIADPRYDYVAAASEGEAVAIAAGAWLAGRGASVMCQNSGLGNAVNPLTSLNEPFRIPLLLVVTWRGGPGLEDEPQHRLMGQITPDLLTVMNIPHRPFPDSDAAVGPALAEALAHMAQTGLPFAFIMEKGAVAMSKLDGGAMGEGAAGAITDLRRHGAALPTRMAALEALLACVPEQAAVIATTGKCGRELYTLGDRDQHLYQVGSMGCAAPMGLGVALNSKMPVVVIDGDGAALMKLGAMATIGAYAPGNLVHLLLDNGTYDSTGGQPTAAAAVDFAGVAAACGYAGAARCGDVAGFKRALAAAFAKPGPHLIHLRIKPGSMANLGRPTIAPDEVAQRFRAFLTKPRL